MRISTMGPSTSPKPADTEIVKRVDNTDWTNREQ